MGAILKCAERVLASFIDALTEKATSGSRNSSSFALPDKLVRLIMNSMNQRRRCFMSLIPCRIFAMRSTLLLSLGHDYACKALLLQEELYV